MFLADERPQLLSEVVARLNVGFEHNVRDHCGPGGVVGDADCGRLVDGVVVDEYAFDLGRADLSAGDVQGVVGASVEEPEAVCVLLCEVAVVPQILPRRPVLLQIALVARPQRLRHRGTGVARDEVAALARLFDRLATLVDDIDVHPEPRTAQRAGFQRLVRHWHEEAAADLRAARDVDDRAVAAADRVVEPAPRFGIPRLAGRAQDSE